MMVRFAIVLETAFINTGRYYRLIRDIHNGFCFIAICKRLLDAYFERSSVRLFSYAKNISAQVNDPAFYTLGYKILFNTVSNVSLCYSTQINLDIRRIKGNDPILQIYVLIATGRKGSVNGTVFRWNRIFSCKIPKRCKRCNGNVKGTLGSF